MEKAISGIFLGNPISRASEVSEESEEEEADEGLGGLVSKMTDVWTDNFSWDYGRFSPKNIIIPSDDRLQYNEEKKLKERGEEISSDEEYFLDEVFAPDVDYGEHYKSLHMSVDSSQKVCHKM